MTDIIKNLTIQIVVYFCITLCNHTVDYYSSKRLKSRDLANQSTIANQTSSQDTSREHQNNEAPLTKEVGVQTSLTMIDLDGTFWYTKHIEVERDLLLQQSQRTRVQIINEAPPQNTNPSPSTKPEISEPKED